MLFGSAVEFLTLMLFMTQVADNLVKKECWKQQYAANIKDQLWPATFTVFALFG